MINSMPYPDVQSSNSLLAAFGPEARRRLLRSALRTVAPAGHSPGLQAFEGRAVYFPDNGLVSELWSDPEGRIAETTVVGPEGAVGFVEALADRPIRSQHRSLVAGGGWLVRATSLRTLVQASEAAAQVAWDHVEQLRRESRQAIACRALHKVQMRLADTLLGYSERIGSDGVPVTHEVLGWSLGVCRTTVTMLMRELIGENLVTPGRGRMLITAPERLDELACGCRHHGIAAQRGREARPSAGRNTPIIAAGMQP